ncbi:hypothetical protein [Paenibacillus piri]|uniref:Uncharacterized protein n=1 Tax=Paenibacillus piri TaxID=2547395 RepID=A0A4R5KIY4_9BACL|nr:hypothetical protein [Paenibacillus piri]TDF94397.1 hypothetical protein E1757_23570 [Paenibacillus piri]
MRKKWLIAGTGFGIGAVMLVVGGLSAMANTSGYDAYKTAAKNLKAESSLTANADLTITDNGKNVLSGTANVKLNHAAGMAGSVAAAFNDGTNTQTLNVFCEEGKVIFKSSADDVYRVMDHSGSGPQHEGDKPGMPKAAEQVLDQLMGNMKGLATVENGLDGGKEASLHLSGSQIPAVVNALGSLAVSPKNHDGSGWHRGGWNEDGKDGNPFFAASDLKVNMPKLVDDIKVEAVNLDAKINPDNVLVGQTAEINVTGKDSSGNSHAVAIRLHVDFSGFNQTSPDRIDLTGKQTVPIQNQWSNRGGWHH